MRISFLLDEDVHPMLAEALQKRGIDAVHVQELARKGIDDLSQLIYAAEQNRCLVSFNKKDFALLHYKYMDEGSSHAGIVVSNQCSIGELLSKLILLAEVYFAKEMVNHIEVFVDDYD